MTQTLARIAALFAASIALAQTAPAPAGPDSLPKADSRSSSPVSAAELKALPGKLGQILGSIVR